MARRKRKTTTHPHREVELAIRDAVDAGWELFREGDMSDSVTWGRLISPNGVRSVWLPASPRQGNRVAKEIRSEVDLVHRQRTVSSPPEPKPEGQDTKERALVVAAFSRLSDQLLCALAENPKLLHALHWREFEELVADLLSREGLEVNLTPGSRDRGVDIYARHYGPMGSTLYVVECKHFGPKRPVGPDLVRLLYGVVERERATKGLLVTSSYFTVEAEREVEQELAYRLSLRDGTGVAEWIEGAARSIRSPHISGSR